MKRFFLIAACALSVSACALSVSACATVPGAGVQPSAYADQTKADEQSAQTAELAYKSWRVAVTAGAQAGLIKGQTATDIAAIDNKLYAALTIVESAYAGGNSTTIAGAVNQFNTALTQANALIGSK